MLRLPIVRLLLNYLIANAMSNYSLRRVAQYARYHYASMRNNYLMLLLVMVGVPTLFGVLNRNVFVTVDCAGSIYILGGIAFAYRTTYAMRDRGSLVLDGALPVSPAERFTFMLFNLAIAFPLSSIITALVSIFAVLPFCDVEPISPLNDFWNNYLSNWQIYCVTQIIQSVCLFLNLVSRRSLLVTYLLAILSVNLLIYFLVEVLMSVDVEISCQPNISENVLAAVLLITPIVIFYTLSYLVLRRRQTKW